VLVDGRDLAAVSRRELRDLRTRIGFVHQDLALVPNLRVSQNVLSGALGRRGFLSVLRLVFFPARADLVRAFSLLGTAGIPEKLYERTDRLSGGQQQRVAVARALMPEPRALLADEPVSSVDPARAEDLVALLAGLSAGRGLTLLMSLHNLELARRHFPRLVGLKGGRVVFDAPTDSVGEDDFRELYRLAKGEMLADGT
ncbi:MAG: ATP-binding cassette domain-containing protein, partial [Planctomycetes bacterium]|nr:ATP-binding cassette domain-containing protein [Planctomycetota bacterium]